ncbi:hypothetical protein [Acidovorax sp. NCPPB 3576]|uniref:hypothetical protein n=1 Tax=Acidovorax sp. NCPPB 3576 TaxID=2940488 RepID=UPI00234BE113|nr:hypothetical protein [Acidovorax sp. NCPPB 3576]WCM87114.1 hypothetical protein M5C98_17315 [Acidovorax sp. NCPPB 3576]
MTQAPRHTAASAPATATVLRLVLDIAPGQHVLACLPPSSTLQALEGNIVLGFGPLICGQVLHARRQTLAAGQALSQDGGATSTWVQLGNPGRQTVHAVLIEAVPQPGGLAQAWAWMKARWTAAGGSGARAPGGVGTAH